MTVRKTSCSLRSKDKRADVRVQPHKYSRGSHTTLRRKLEVLIQTHPPSVPILDVCIAGAAEAEVVGLASWWHVPAPWQTQTDRYSTTVCVIILTAN